jgi:hypothetical protein
MKHREEEDAVEGTALLQDKQRIILILPVGKFDLGFKAASTFFG